MCTPGFVFFIFDRILQIPFYVGKTFLMCRTIFIEGFFMIMDNYPAIIFSRSPCYTFMTFFGSCKILGFTIRCCGYETYAFFPFTLAFVQSICITGDSIILLNSSFCSFIVFLANSLLRLLIMPLEILSFPFVRSDRNFCDLSIDTQHSLFNRNRNALTLPSGLPVSFRSFHGCLIFFSS